MSAPLRNPHILKRKRTRGRPRTIIQTHPEEVPHFPVRDGPGVVGHQHRYAVTAEFKRESPVTGVVDSMHRRQVLSSPQKRRNIIIPLIVPLIDHGNQPFVQKQLEAGIHENPHDGPGKSLRELKFPAEKRLFRIVSPDWND